MAWTNVMRQLAGAERDARDIDEADAYCLLAAMLDDGVPDLELGAVLAGLQAINPSLGRVLGFHRALVERASRLVPPEAPARPVVLASHGGTREQPNLTALIALMLRRFGVPVLIHGALNGGGGTGTAAVLREMGVMPCAHLAQAQAQLIEHKIAFVPTAVVAPGLSKLFGACAHLGLGGTVLQLARLVDPFGGASLLVTAATCKREHELMHDFFEAARVDALLLEGTEGEPFAHPLRRPELRCFRAGEGEVLFDAETASLRNLSTLPRSIDASSTASWIARVLGGEVPLPLPLANQIACCLYGSGYTHDMNQAKAIAAIETGSLVAA